MTRISLSAARTMAAQDLLGRPLALRQLARRVQDDWEQKRCQRLIGLIVWFRIDPESVDAAAED